MENYILFGNHFYVTYTSLVPTIFNHDKKNSYPCIDGKIFKFSSPPVTAGKVSIEYSIS